MSHANARLTPRGRLALARCIVDDGWAIRRAAERFQASPTTAARWASRYRQYGVAGLVDRSSRPHRCAHRTPTRRERRIIGVRVTRRWGPARIGFLLGMHPSTVHKVLARHGLARLTWLDRGTGRVIRRYEHERPGDLVHVDIKKLGRIPEGGGHKVLGRAAGIRVKKGAKPGYAYLHHAVDDHSRLVYSEILTNERSQTAAAFWVRANAYFNSCGFTVARVLTDNGPCYRAKVFDQALGDVVHKKTRPYRPQTNGKVERFNRTLLEEWAYFRPYASESERVATYPEFIHNHHRGHTALGGNSPADRVPNLCGQYT